MRLNTVAQLTHIPMKKLLKIEIFRLWETDRYIKLIIWLRVYGHNTSCLFVCVCVRAYVTEGLSYKRRKILKAPHPRRA